MKKIFYILASAIVALGAVACENDGLDNIGLEVNGDTVSFIASIDNTRTDLNGLQTVWDENDTIVVEWNGTKYNFTNAGAKNKNIFSCSAEGLSGIVDAAEIKATYSHNGDGFIDSNAGTAGALLTYTGPFAGIEFAVENAFLKFTAEKDAEVKLTASAEIFSTGNTLTLKGAGKEQYVAVVPEIPTTITYAINGTNYGVSQENTFVAGKIYPLGDLEVPGWNLVTDASKLAVGDQIVIAAATSNKALGTTQNNNNRAGVDATKDKTNNTIAVGADVQKIILEAGTTTGTFAFKVGTQYLYAASSSSNHLKSGVKNDNASWKISISNNVATVVAQGENTRNTIYFNANNGNPIFSAYGNGNKPDNGGEDIVIYKYAGKGTPIATKLEMSDDITCTAQTENTLTFTWSAVANATGYEVNINNKTETVTEPTYTATSLEAETEYTISVKAIGDGTFYTTSEAKEGKGTTAEKQQQPEGGEVTIVASEQGIGNSTEVETLTAGPITVTFNKGSNSNAPKYYSSGTAFRVYGGNYFTVSSDKNIVKIVLTYGSSDGSNNISTDCGSFNTNTWTGSSKSVKFTIGGSTGNRRIAKIEVTYEGTTGGETPAEVVKPTITVEDQTIESAECEDTVQVTVTNMGNWQFEATTDVDWLEVEWDNGVSYHADANTDVNKREATVIIIATLDGQTNVTQTFKITQAAAEVVEPEQPGDGGESSEPVTQTLSCLFSDNGNPSWNNSYNARTLTYDVAKIIFSGASKQASTITDCPVVKNHTVDVVMTNDATITAVTYTCKQWSSKTQTMELYYSTNGTSFTKTTTNVTWSNYTLTCTSLPEGTVAVRAKGTNSSNQIGIKSVTVTYKN